MFDFKHSLKSQARQSICAMLIIWGLPHVGFAQNPTVATAQKADATFTKKSLISVHGLKNPAEILIDQWGVPHIFAANEDDLFFVQGWNVARDRLFQIDLWRRRGLGQLAEVFGASYIEQDKATRLFLYRGDMKKEWAAYGKQAQGLTQRFVEGINAYIDYLEQHPDALPPEFSTLNYRPAKWQAHDVVRIRSHGLTRNLTSEVMRARFACAGKLEADELRQTLSPTWTTRVPEGLNLCLPDDVLRVFNLATQNVPFHPQQLSHAAPEATPQVAQNDHPSLDPHESLEGSNNWVIAANKSSTGRPILANDPHRAYSTPSLRYITHLHSPTLNVIGAGEPALPGISIGHNGHIAFGLTIMSIDQEDLYVVDTHPRHPQQYRYRGRWEQFQTLTETLAVKNKAEQKIELTFTRHGPVIYRDLKNHKAYALRTAWMQAGMAPYFGSVNYMRATHFAAFKQAMLHWGAPTENQVYADTKGNIAWVPGGLTPIRPNWDGLLPVPGDGRYEWKGFLSGKQLPYKLNPPEGWFASANEMNLPKDYPYQERKLGFEWPHPSRYQRIAQVLSQDKKWRLEDSQHLQNDVFSLPAQRLIALLKTIQVRDEKKDENSTQALQLLTQWDFQEHAESPAAALFQYWLTQSLAPAYRAQLLGSDANLFTTMPHLSRLLEELEAFHPLPSLGKTSLEQARQIRDNLLINSLSHAWRALTQRLGKNPTLWRWGDLQRTTFPHPLSSLPKKLTQGQFDVPDLPRGGSAYTVNQSTYRLNDFVQSNGPSFRIIIDVGHWDASLAMNAPGQSGLPSSPHYRDLALPWSKGEYFPLLYSRSAIEKHTQEIWQLNPSPSRSNDRVTKAK